MPKNITFKGLVKIDESQEKKRETLRASVSRAADWYRLSRAKSDALYEDLTKIPRGPPYYIWESQVRILNTPEPNQKSNFAQWMSDDGSPIMAFISRRQHGGPIEERHAKFTLDQRREARRINQRIWRNIGDVRVSPLFGQGRRPDPSLDCAIKQASLII